MNQTTIFKFILLALFFLPKLVLSQVQSVLLNRLPKEINTLDNEEMGQWTLDGKNILFTRMTNDEVGLYKASLDAKGGVSRVDQVPVDSKFRGGGYSISTDGQTMLLTICGARESLGGCDLYQSHLMQDRWSPPENMGHAYNSPRWESQPSYGLDGLSIYFASTRPGGFGGSDIWMVRQISPGIVSKPVNAGPGVNTPANEGSPFIHFDGRKMYFMRDGTDGYGGYDMYMSGMSPDGKWMQSENMGSYVNSAADEGGLAIHPNGKMAMITRSMQGQQNDLFTFELPLKFQSAPVQALRVHVTDEVAGAPVRARVEVFMVTENDTIRQSRHADEAGNMTVTLDREKDFGLVATADGYVMYSARIPASDEDVRAIEIKMTPVLAALKKTITLQNIFFESGSAELQPASTHELNKLYQSMKGNTRMKIEIRGHTDDVGSEEKNLVLSESRAKSVYQYLIDQGIEPDRLAFVGYGETKPIADNHTEQGRLQNRRTEFFIIKI